MTRDWKPQQLGVYHRDNIKGSKVGQTKFESTRSIVGIGKWLDTPRGLGKFDGQSSVLG